MSCNSKVDVHPWTQGASRIESIPTRLRRDARAIVAEAKHVKLQTSQVTELSRRMAGWDAAPWMHASPVQFGDLKLDARIGVALVFNAISFCYWPEPWWDNDLYESSVRRGSWALLGSLRHAIDEGVPILSPQFLSAVDGDELLQILHGRGRLAMVPRRAEILREVGRGLREICDGEVMQLVIRAGFDEPQLVDLIIGAFPSFRDIAMCHGRRVPFSKRAQLLAADCHRILNDVRGHGLTAFEQLTACPDYMLPALLLKEGVLVYSEDLRQSIAQRIPLLCEGRQEVEIRAATIVGCDLLADASGLPPMLVNDILWRKAGEVFSDNPSHHRTWTEAY